MSSFPLRLASLMAVLALAACESADDASGQQDASTARQPRMETIGGTVTFADRIKLAPESRVIVELKALDDRDEPANTVAEAEIYGPGQPPVAFGLRYDANLVDPARRYVLVARIMERKRLMFITEAPYPVLEDRRQGPVDMVLAYVPGGDPKRMASNLKARHQVLNGHYQYVNKAGRFIDCSNDRVYPIARGPGTFELESNYRDVASGFGDTVFVRLIGDYEPRAAADGSGKRPHLVVSYVEEMTAAGACPP